MNRVNLELLDKQSSVLDEKQEYLKQYGLDEESIKEFRSKIKKVSQEEADRLGEELNQMMYDCWYSDEDIVSFDEEIYEDMLSLILNGADVNYVDGSDSTTLSYASCSLEYSILLIKAGAECDIVQRDGYGYTLAMIVALNNFSELLKILILLGTNINKKNCYGYDALHYAVFYNQKECIKLLEDAMQGKNIITADDIKSDKKALFTEVAKENISHDKNSSKELSELTPEELLQEAEDRLNEVLGNTLVRKRSK